MAALGLELGWGSDRGRESGEGLLGLWVLTDCGSSAVLVTGPKQGDTGVVSKDKGSDLTPPRCESQGGFL